MINLAIFTSGNGSNVENIHKYINNRKLNNPDRTDSMSIKMVFTDNKNAYVLSRCERLDIPYFILNNDDDKLINKLKKEKIGFIVLSDFYGSIPENIIKIYKKRIINTHPSLLPKYNNINGMDIHRKVIENGDKYSGLSFYYINTKYKDYDIIIRLRQKINDSDNPEILANKIHLLEHKWYPIVVYSLISKL